MSLETPLTGVPTGSQSGSDADYADTESAPESESESEQESDQFERHKAETEVRRAAGTKMAAGIAPLETTPSSFENDNNQSEPTVKAFPPISDDIHGANPQTKPTTKADSPTSDESYGASPSPPRKRVKPITPQLGRNSDNTLVSFDMIEQLSKGIPLGPRALKSKSTT